MVALDGGVVETSAELPMERRLERIHRALAELIEWHEPKALALEDIYFGKQRALGDGRRPGQRRRDARRRPARACAASPTRRRRSRWRSAAPARPASSQVQRMVGHPARPAGARRRSDHAADALAVAICHGGGAGAAPGARGARPSAAPPRRPAGAARRMIAAVRGEVLVRRPDHVVIDAGGRRLPARGLRGDAEVGARRPGARPSCTRS